MVSYLYLFAWIVLGSWAKHDRICDNTTFPKKLKGLQFYGMEGGEEVSGPDACRAKCCEAGYTLLPSKYTILVYAFIILTQ